jgi:hypothetical protein
MLREQSRKDEVLFYLASAAVGLLAAFAMIALAVGSASAQDHPDFSGNWKLNAGASKIKDSKLTTECSKLTIAQKGGSITLVEADGDQHECSTTGKECATKASKVSFWFSGPKLVEMEYKGHADHARKRRLTLSADGKTMQMEVIPIAPAGETSMLAFDKAQ